MVQLADSILSWGGLPMTPLAEGIIIFLLLLAAAFLIWLVYQLLFPPARYGGKRPSVEKKEVENPFEKYADATVVRGLRTEVLTEPELRSRWDFYEEKDLSPELKILADKVEVDGEEKVIPREPVLQGLVVALPEKGDVLFVGEGDVWYQFSSHEGLSDSARSLFQVTHDEYVDQPEVSDKKEPWIWEGLEWKIEDKVGPFRVKVEGNHFMSGNEIVRLMFLTANDPIAADEEEHIGQELYLAVDVTFSGGRTFMGGKITLWKQGRFVTPEEVEQFMDLKVKITSPMMEAVMKH